MPQLTTHQHQAIHTHDHNLIVVAGAGSGKTYVLVERYLALLDQNPTWNLNQLVAITFTKKAAQEMRDRVREALQKNVYEKSDEQAELWSKRLTAMDSARIDTIHAMCASILRANAAEAGVDPGFEVLDEVDAQLLLENAIDDTLRALVADDSPALELFREYDARTVRQLLAEFASADIGDLPADIFDGWTAAWHTHASDSLQSLYEHPDFVMASSWQPPGEFPTGDDLLLNVWKACYACFDELRAQDDVLAHLDILARLASEIKLTGGKAGIWGDKQGVEDAKAPLKILRPLTQEVLKTIGSPPGDGDRRAAEMLPYWHQLIGQVQDTYRRAKTERAAVDFDDLERLTRDVLRDYPHVRARYQGKEFQHVLVDEFQDTNAVQWEIVQALASLDVGGSLFVVGDPKQSIYAFRGADVSVFETVRGQIVSGSVGLEIPLARSFRTHHLLVEGFNSIFARLLVRDERSPVRGYQTLFDTPMEAERANAPCDEPSLELVLLDKEQLDGEEDKAEKARRWEAREIARRLKALVETGRPIYDKKARVERPIHYGDVAVLYQSMSNITLYEDVFKEEGLPFVTVAGRGYYNRQEVWDMLNLLHALYNPADSLSLVAALRSPLFSLSDDALLALRLWANEQSSTDSLWLWHALEAENAYLPHDEVPQVRFAFRCLTELRRMAGRVTISELLSAALDQTGYLAVLTGLPDGARRRGNVEKLLEKAQSSGMTTLGAFAHYLKDLTDREIHEGEAVLEDAGAVKLMTVHKSKGLEFPVVVLADASWERGAGGTKHLVYDPAIGLACRVYDHAEEKYASTFASARVELLRKGREEAERRRLLYVAATRAQDLLIVTGQITRKDGALKTNGWLEWLVDALEARAVEPLARQIHDCGWGVVDVRFPTLDAEQIAAEVHAASVWDASASTREHVSTPDETSSAPPLLAAVRQERDAPARAMTATQIADLGGAIYADAQDRLAFIQRWRRKVLHDAPSRIERITPGQEGVSARKVGEIVHKTLRWWKHGTNDGDLLKRLDAYAWEEGVVTDEDRKEAVRRAYRLMHQVLASDVEAWVANAQAVYRELPFVFQTDKRLIHGIIDVLIQRTDGSWALIDYKTSFVSARPDAAALAHHAQRYHLQVGVYAAAVQALLGIEPVDVYIHYIRHEQTVTVASSAWQSALEQLERHIGTLIEMDSL